MELLNGSTWNASFKAFQCGKCVKLSTSEMVEQLKINTSALENERNCPHCDTPIIRGHISQTNASEEA